jgi:peptidoglycan/LPS O-acetylase OafA/YrhL
LFDGLRGLAVLAIFSFHAAEFTHHLGVGVPGRAAEAAGGQAVITFFVISGFLLYRPFVASRAQERRAPSSVKYGRRRALRILPGYWAILTLLALFPGIVGVFTADWWRYYGYLQLYAKRTLAGGIPVAWTLCIEVTFYIALPIWAWTMRRHTGRRVLRGELIALAALATGGAIVQLLAARQQIGYVIGISLLGQCTWLAIGMALAVASATTAPPRGIGRALAAVGSRSGLCWIGSALAFVVLVILVPKGGLFGLITAVEARQSGWRTVVKIAAEGACVVLFVLPAVFGSVKQGLPRRLLAWRPVVWLGVISYSFYLLHLTIIEFLALGHSPTNFSTPGLGLETHQGTLRSITLVVLSLSLTVLLASASYRFIELPFLRRKER